MAASLPPAAGRAMGSERYGPLPRGLALRFRSRVGCATSRAGPVFRQIWNRHLAGGWDNVTGPFETRWHLAVRLLDTAAREAAGK